MAIVGIDLGTTNSVCSIWRGDKVELIPNRLGQYLTPSVISIDDNRELLVGVAAKERLITHPAQTVAVFKRMMGTKFSIKLGKQEFTPVELSSLVLKALVEDVKAFLGEAVEEAVISVPAYFNDHQRNATKLAGELAGLKVRRLINEPTAAAMAYGLHQKQEGTFMILDMGGGTFDVSILEYFEGVMEVHASCGDNYLGGEDFVDAMIKAMLQDLDIQDLSVSPEEKQKLTMQMETLKRQINRPDLMGLTVTINNKDYDWQPTKDWFQEAVMPLLVRSKAPIVQAMRDSNIRASDIDNVILVGGATRLDLFRSAMAKLFGRFPNHDIDPDLAICMGAGIQAGLLNKEAALDDVVLTDICPYSLGTAVLDPSNNEQTIFLPILERNTVVPASRVETVYTAHDNQKKMMIDVYQGEHRDVSRNIQLGQFEIQVPKSPKGEQGVDIRYSYDVNGLLEVDATVHSTGKHHNLLIENSAGRLTKAEIDRSKERLLKLKRHPKDEEDNRRILARGERLYACSLEETRMEISNLIGLFEKVLKTQNPHDIAKMREKLSNFFDDIDDQEWF